MDLCLALDVGGTKLQAGLVTGGGEIVDGSLRRLATPTTTDADVLFAAVAGLLTAVREQARDEVAVCGVGAGGPMDRGGEHVSPLNIPAWRSFPLRRRLSQLLQLPVAVDNDAKALTLAEGWRGAARGVGAYLGMVVSTGVGGGVVLDGRLLQGTAGNAGHVGHVVVEPDGRCCSCGGRGCLEAEASGTAIAAITGRPAADAGPGDVERCGQLVGRAVASVANLLDLQLAVVAGSVALGFGPPFFEAANAEVQRRCRLDFSRSTRVVPAGLGAAGPLIGAGAVGWDHLGAREQLGPRQAPGPEEHRRAASHLGGPNRRRRL